MDGPHWLRRCVLPAQSRVYEARLRTVSPRNIWQLSCQSLLRSCLGPQTANRAILAGVFDITITFHHLLSPLRLFKYNNQDIYYRLDDLVAWGWI